MNNQQDMYIFLGQQTPKHWFEQVPEHLEELLIDHAHCERKAAQFALKMMPSGANCIQFVNYISRLAREELVHFERVLKLLKQKGIQFRPLSSAQYGQGLHALLSSDQEKRFIDKLLIAAFIEARSCERFLGMIPFLEPEVAFFYERLAKSEARHYEGYLAFAHEFCADKSWLQQRVEQIRVKENQLMSQPAKLFRFHSGPFAL